MIVIVCDTHAISALSDTYHYTSRKYDNTHVNTRPERHQPIIIFTLLLVTCAINFGVGKLAKSNYSNLVCEQMVSIDTKTAEIMKISIESWERCCAVRGTNLNIALGNFG